jgi:protocatechuate 3,4-dioxygenase beta subunit
MRRALAPLFLALLLAACGTPSTSGSAPTHASGTAATGAVSCSRTTPAQTEGPYFKSGSPERSSLVEPGMPGTHLSLSGRVLSASCNPIDHALLDFWQADASGNYDNGGYRLRGHLFTNDQGEYALETVVPGPYPGRTQHIHVKVQAPGGPVLTTQLYFPGQARNRQDSIFDPALLMDVRDESGGKTATFNFVLAAG